MTCVSCQTILKSITWTMKWVKVKKNWRRKKLFVGRPCTSRYGRRNCCCKKASPSHYDPAITNYHRDIAKRIAQSKKRRRMELPGMAGSYKFRLLSTIGSSGSIFGRRRICIAALLLRFRDGVFVLRTWRFYSSSNRKQQNGLLVNVAFTTNHLYAISCFIGFSIWRTV